VKAAMELYFVTVPSIVALALLALKKGFLTVRGTLSAIVVGSVVAVAHMGLFMLLALFFVSSSLLTRVRAEWKRSMGLKDVSGRSLRQVIGVGTPIAVFAGLYAALGDPKLLGAAAVAVAAATADTWASEVGVAYGGRPRYILAPWRRMEPGVSGGVTPVGAAASAAGALFIAAFAPLLGVVQPLWKIALFGYLGEVLDSVLGAALQVKYLCNGKISEAPAPGCRRRGFLSNEAVNLVSGLAVGALYVATA
jgi:Predicted membrane protein